MNDTSGPISQTPSAFLDPDGSCWRTSQGTLLSEAPPLLQSLPKWGTAFNGELFALAPPVLPTNDSGFSSLPTPTARDYKDTGDNTDYERIAAKAKLAGTVHLLPTPVVNDMGENHTIEWWNDWIKEKRLQHNNSNGHGKSLSIEARLLPTPRAQNGEARNMNIWERPLDQPQNLENALARLTGENTNQPSDGGNTSLDE